MNATFRDLPYLGETHYNNIVAPGVELNTIYMSGDFTQCGGSTGSAYICAVDRLSGNRRGPFTSSYTSPIPLMLVFKDQDKIFTNSGSCNKTGSIVETGSYNRRIGYVRNGRMITSAATYYTSSGALITTDGGAGWPVISEYTTQMVFHAPSSNLYVCKQYVREEPVPGQTSTQTLIARKNELNRDGNDGMGTTLVVDGRNIPSEAEAFDYSGSSIIYACSIGRRPPGDNTYPSTSTPQISVINDSTFTHAGFDLYFGDGPSLRLVKLTPPYSILFDSKDNAIYFGGEFTSVAYGYVTSIGFFDYLEPGTHSKRYGLCRYDLNTNTTSSFAPVVTGGNVYAMEMIYNVLYIGGNFTHVNGVARSGAAAVDKFNGRLLPWNPSPNGAVRCISVAKYEDGTAPRKYSPYYNQR